MLTSQGWSLAYGFDFYLIQLINLIGLDFVGILANAGFSKRCHNGETKGFSRHAADMGFYTANLKQLIIL